MAKTIKIKYTDKNGDEREYTLEYTRRSVKMLEDRGFRINDITEKPMSALPSLFAGAFLAHHPMVKSDKIDEIFKGIRNKDEFLLKLAEMYQEPLEALMGEPDEGEEKNATNWEASF